MCKLGKSLYAAPLALALLLASCVPAFAPKSETAIDQTGISITVLMPDFASHATASRVIAAQSFAARLSIGGDDYEFTLGTSAVVREGEPRTLTAQVGGIPAKYYNKATLSLFDVDGKLLTTGAAFNFTIQPLVYTPLHFKCFVTDETSSFLTINAPTSRTELAAGKMAFYKFFGRPGVAYTIELDAGFTGTPDIYLYMPNGSAGKNQDSTYIRSIDQKPLAYTISASGAGMYVVGVYAFGGPVSYALTAKADPLAVGNSPAQMDIDAGYAILRDGDVVGALAKFTQALATDGANGDANLGAALCTLVTVVADPQIASLATDNLGFVGFPTDIQKILSTSWLETVITSQNSQSYTYMPKIVGMEKYDGKFDGHPDGIIDPNERLMAFASYYVTHNVGFDPVVQKLTGAIQAKFERASELIESINADMKLTLTWDSFFETPEDMWDLVHMTPETLPTVTIGKAELLAIAGIFRTVQTFATMGSVYSFDLSSPDGSNFLKDFYDAIGIENADWDGSKVNPDDIFGALSSPFAYENFLKPSADAVEKLFKAKNAFGAFLDAEREAIVLIRDRAGDSGFMITPTLLATLLMENQSPSADDIATVKDLLGFPIRAIDEVTASLDAAPKDKRVAFIPIPSGGQNAMTEILDFAKGTTPWPTVANGKTVIGVNVGTIFANPLASLIELSINGEPVFYCKVSDTTGYYMKGQSFGTTATFSENMTYYIKTPDITLGGIIDPANIAHDDPSTRMKIGSFVWNDQTYPNDDALKRTDNGKWDPDELLTGSTTKGYCELRIESAIEGGNSGPFGGLIDVARLDEYKLDGNIVTPESYYNFQNLTRAEVIAWLESFTEPATSPLAAFTAEANVAPLLALIKAGGIYVHWWSTTYSYGAPLLDGTSLYQAVPDSYVWHSATPVGTPNPHGGVNSLGSFWYSLPFGY